MEPSELLRIVSDVLESMRLKYLVTGSMATILYGEPRYTNDIDIVVDLPLGRSEELCRHFPQSQYYLDKTAVRDAVQNKDQFNILHPSSGLKVDMMILGNTEFDQARLDRRRRLQAGDDCRPYFASPEDVILKKLEFYKIGGSEKHLRDIAGVLKISSTQIDRGYIQDWAKKLDLEDVWKQFKDQSGL